MVEDTIDVTSGHSVWLLTHSPVSHLYVPSGHGGVDVP